MSNFENFLKKVLTNTDLDGILAKRLEERGKRENTEERIKKNFKEI